ncbi:hypothetical protein [Gemmata sp.]|uniref:hypothetical protein n=1 Tax=Gemmata sp. TaxID=1914242 RepID=UPI003F6FBF33
MSEITLDAATAARVTKSLAATRLCDPEGRTVAYAMSPRDYEAWTRRVIEEAKAEVTNEELLRIAATPPTKTMDDVFKLLEDGE